MLNNSYTTDKQRLGTIVEQVQTAESEKEGFFAEGLFRPENDFVRLIIEHGEDRNNPGFAVTALFLATTLVFAGDTGVLFKNLTDVSNFNEYWWIFDPNELVRILEGYPSVKLFNEVNNGYIKCQGFQINALKEWEHNCRILVDQYRGDVTNLFKLYNNDAYEIYKALVVKAHAKGKSGIRRFGPKLASLMLYWVRVYDIYELTNYESVPSFVDFQIARVLLQLGVIVPISDEIGSHFLTYKVIPSLLHEVCLKNGWDHLKVAEMLWNIGVLGCSSGRHDACPVRELCGFLIPSRAGYDGRGIISVRNRVDWREL